MIAHPRLMSPLSLRRDPAETVIPFTGSLPDPSGGQRWLPQEPRLPRRTEHCNARWHGNGATLLNLLTGAEETVPASALVMASINLAFDPFSEISPGKTLYRVGDCIAPRPAAHALHDGRKLAL